VYECGRQTDGHILRQNHSPQNRHTLIYVQRYVYCLVNPCIAKAAMYTVHLARSSTCTKCTIRLKLHIYDYVCNQSINDTILVYLRVLKSWRDGQLSLAHGTETKNKRKLTTSSSAVADKSARRATSRQRAKFWTSHVTITTPLLLVICRPVVRIDIAYSCTKFDDFRFSRSSDMIGAPKIL